MDVGLVWQAVPQWENVFSGSPVTCLDASESKSVLVAASEAGGIAWLKLDHVMSVSKIGASHCEWSARNSSADS